MKKVELGFYSRPFKRDSGRGFWIYSGSDFAFQVDDKNYIEPVLNCINDYSYGSPIPGLNLSINPLDPTEILNHGKLFITIRGWGNLTGIGAHRLGSGKAIEIQNNLRDWLIQTLVGDE